ncbi:ABC transporter ATP-binding protein [Porphyromonas pogonae]|uniref:ABC transporter ATP-binding protein n=1 Tax=Porphyromonas pogonae TaxID=867595 RepID=UPI002E762999|nr:ABC transporter ATP-binding protein [Porphyromonas pogonae]
MKGSTISNLRKYMGNRKELLTMSLITSALSSIAGVIPFICIWVIVRMIFEDNHSTDTISLYAWVAFGFSILCVILYFASLMLSHLAAFRVEKNMRFTAMQKAVHIPLGFYNKNTVGKMRKIIDDNASITHVFTAHQLPDLIGGIMMLVTTFIFLFVFDWRMGLVCLIPLIIAVWMFQNMMGNKTYQESMTQYMNFLEKMNTEAVEYIRGIPVVKVFQQTVYSFKRFYKSIMTYSEWAGKYTVNSRTPMLIYTLALNGFIFLLIPFAVILINTGSDWREVVINLIFYILITPFFNQSLMKIMFMSHGKQQADEALIRIDKLMSEYPCFETEEQDKPIIKYDIDLIKVSFTYDKGEKEAIHNLSLHIPENKTYALVGASGSGKTTLVRLMARFWDCTQGEVRIGGINVKHITPEELMKHISFVFQNTTLFKTTIRENILYGKPDASQEELDRAIKMAQCEDIINKLPDGLDTKLGTEGIYLSGGEQQRIALARAFLKDAPILLLDEATAFADPENEHEIQIALRSLMENKTVVMIAHRLSSVTNVDRIIVIEEGTIAEQGNHQELLDNKGLYYTMWNEYQQSVRWTIKMEEVQ